MKKLLLFIAFGFSFISLNAQEIESQRRNDIVADPFLLIAVPLLNVSYERLLNENSGLGVNAMVGLGEDSEGFSQVSPYYRMYFGRKFAQGFFLEGFVPITTTRESESVYTANEFGGYYTDGGEIRETTVGIGFGVGGKWVIRNGLVIEASGGLGRRFGSGLDDEWVGEGVTGKIMGGIGYRF
jgi:hypothetical protein